MTTSIGQTGRLSPLVPPLRVLGGTFLGYLVMGLLITLVQEVGFGGVHYGDSSLLVLLVAGLGTFLSAAAGGALAAGIAGRGAWFAAGLMVALVGVETTWLVRTGRADGPLWFDVLAAVSLMVGVVVGALLWARRTRDASASAPSAG